MKPSAHAVLLFLRKKRRYVTSAEVIRAVYTTTPSKRLDELHDAGLIENAGIPRNLTRDSTERGGETWRR